MKNNRRTFLQLAGTVSAGTLLFPHLGCSATKNNMSTTTSGIDKFGIQLYTLRDDMPKDPKGVLKQLASYGYKQIESYEGPEGIFWGMGHTGFSKYLNDLGMKLVSSHCDIKTDFEKKASQAAEIGMSYLVCPWIGPQKSVEDWKKVTDLFNECGAICKKNGIRFAYHNHEYTFRAFTGMIPHDFIMDNTDPDLVYHEMDIYWVIVGGADPKEYLKKYSNRFKLCHIKDRLKGTPEGEKSASCILGTGEIDFPSILKVAKEHGMEYFITEQERYDAGTPLESVKANAAYMKGFKFA
jgi:sugar phosphate isomerase/epimerase